MPDIKISNKTFEGVTSVCLKTTVGNTVTFPKYVIGAPVNVVLYADNWNGTTYTLKVENYQVGEYGVQIGLPAEVDTTEAQMIIESALTIPYTLFTGAKDSAAAYTTLRISAIKTPTKDISVSLFGMEVV